MNCYLLTIEGLWKKAGDDYILICFLGISQVAPDYGGETIYIYRFSILVSGHTG